jgi:hypothetical protein
LGKIANEFVRRPQLPDFEEISHWFVVERQHIIARDHRAVAGAV